MVLRVAAATLRLATVARAQRVDIDGKLRQAAPALGAANGRVRALKEALAPRAMDYEYGICRRRVFVRRSGEPSTCGRGVAGRCSGVGPGSSRDNRLWLVRLASR
jgi:hypothetical protein